ncbi:GreA/GreB family elongation factor [Candidatus Saccharibacteria bacterium]|nr:GreA/GreB family elongation factor [Candidatus Saccharibacteria bacterium]
MERGPQSIQETISARNETIRSSLDAGYIPMLAFEHEALQTELEGLLVHQEEQGSLLRVAMEQSSETWHDNANQDIIMRESQTTAARGIRTNDTFRRAKVVDYPPEGDEVTIGSIIEVRFGESLEIENAIITGTAKGLDIAKAFEDDNGPLLPEGCTSFTVQSPAGLALLGARTGEVVSYQGPKMQVQMELVSVKQLIPND